ncbi:MAG: Uma2 family endonuclease [Gammaproteobacteria bacterium]|nr:Uma2 family endonuclease [Gammaproteobacteria bacterium]
MPPAQPKPARSLKRPPRSAPKLQQPANTPVDPPARDDEDRYPDLGVPPMISDHWKALEDSATLLETRYADRDDVFVGSGLTIHYVDGSEDRAIQPDVFVSFGSPNRSRRVWLAWEEGKFPDFVLEVASKSTYRRDEREKRAIYERLGVAEYWQFDPTGEYLNPILQGRCLNAAGTYALLPLTTTPEGGLRGVSEVIALHICAEGPRLRLFDPATGKFLLNHQEEHRGRLAAEAEVEQLKRQLASR